MASAPSAPAAAASVAVNTPKYIPPNTNTGKSSDQNERRSAATISVRVARGSGCSRLLANLAEATQYTAKIADNIRPGTTPAMNSAPIDVSETTPNRTIGPDGGIRIPSVPPAPTTP